MYADGTKFISHCREAAVPACYGAKDTPSEHGTAGSALLLRGTPSLVHSGGVLKVGGRPGFA